LRERERERVYVCVCVFQTQDSVNTELRGNTLDHRVT